jgi:conjugal transfer pilus assembly protein TraU
MSRYIVIIAFFLITFWPPGSNAAVKSGQFVNPITDIAWQEIFPIKIAGITIAPASGNYDTPDPASTPVCVCPAPPPVFYRIGISVSFWEPARMIETVATPYYFPSLGFGLDLASTKGFLSGKNHSLNDTLPDQSTFAQAHYLLFPVWSILGLLTDFVCVEHSGFDVAYITEIDPLWQDDELAFIIQPEALLFANPFAQMACMADSVAVNAYRPLEALYWCVGSGGSAYPMTGHVDDDNIIQANSTIAARLIYKLARELLICDTGLNLCSCVPTPIWYKPNYKLQAVRPAVNKKAWPIGKSAFFYGSNLNPPYRSGKGPGDEFLWMVFRKRACCAF